MNDPLRGNVLYFQGTSEVVSDALGMYPSPNGCDSSKPYFYA